MTDFVVSGSFGFGNAGDEAVLLALQDLAAAVGVRATFQAVGRYDQPALSTVLGIGVEDRGLRLALRGEPLLYAGGGVIEARCECVLVRCASVLEELNPPFAALFAAAVDTSVTYPFLLRRRIRQIVNRMDFLFTRDVASAEMLSALCPGRRKEIECIGDSVLWLRPAEAVPEAISARPYVAVALTSAWDGDPTWDDWISAQLISLCRTLKTDLTFVPLSTRADDDRLVHRRILRRIQQKDYHVRATSLEDELEARTILAILGGARLVVGMRLHACVMAYSQRVPFVGLPYHPKIPAFAATVKHERCVLAGEAATAKRDPLRCYSFAQLELAKTDLVATAMRTLDDRRFEQLEVLRLRLVDGFKTIMNRHRKT